MKVQRQFSGGESLGWSETGRRPVSHSTFAVSIDPMSSQRVLSQETPEHTPFHGVTLQFLVRFYQKWIPRHARASRDGNCLVRTRYADKWSCRMAGHVGCDHAFEQHRLARRSASSSLEFIAPATCASIALVSDRRSVYLGGSEFRSRCGDPRIELLYHTGYSN